MSEVEMLARAVESAIFGALSSASTDPAREEHWRAHADKLERKFTSQHGRHYSYFLPSYKAA